VFTIDVIVYGKLVVSVDGVGWILSPEVTVREFADCVGDVFCATISVLVIGVNVDCTSVTTVGVIVTVC